MSEALKGFVLRGGVKFPAYFLYPFKGDMIVQVIGNKRVTRCDYCHFQYDPNGWYIANGKVYLNNPGEEDEQLEKP